EGVARRPGGRRGWREAGRPHHDTMRIAVPALIALVAAVLGLGAGAQTPPSADRPNILFIMTDDHAAHAISAYGSKVNTTPNLDRLATEGALFSSVFATNS